MTDDANKEQKKQCFIVCPIGDESTEIRTHADWLLHEIIETVLNDDFKDQYKIIRADIISTPGNIDTQVINHILEDDLVIADMSLLNPNVFYEIGIRHMIGKPIIHMFKEGSNIPFDVTTMRAIPFNYDHPAKLSKARKLLSSFVSETQKKDFNVDTPVTRARAYAKIDQIATPVEKIVFSELNKINSRIDNYLTGNINQKTHKNEIHYIQVTFKEDTNENEIDILNRNLLKSGFIYSQTHHPEDNLTHYYEVISKYNLDNFMSIITNSDIVEALIHRER